MVYNLWKIAAGVHCRQTFQLPYLYITLPFCLFQIIPLYTFHRKLVTSYMPFLFVSNYPWYRCTFHRKAPTFQVPCFHSFLFINVQYIQLSFQGNFILSFFVVYIEIRFQKSQFPKKCEFIWSLALQCFRLQKSILYIPCIWF